MSHISIIAKLYAPNTAYGNRLFSFIKGFIKTDDVTLDVYFLLPSENYDLVTDYIPNVVFHYMWRRSDNRIISKIRPYWVTWTMSRYLEPNDHVILYGVSQMVPTLVGKKGLHIYQEKTEHPDVVPFPRFVGKSRYYKSCKKLDGLFVISTALRDFFIEKGVTPEKIHIINMTVDASRFRALKKEVVTEKYIAYSGTASNNKDGVDELIRAFAIVAKKIEGIKLYIIGKTPSRKDEAGNLALIEKLGLNKRIVFQGIIPFKKMPQLLKNAEVVALARPDSLQARCGFATKIGEYLLSENPVVVTSVGDFPLFLKDGENALLCEPGNTEEFAHKLEWAITHKEEAIIIGKKGAEVALSHFNSDLEAKKVLNIIFC